MFAEKGFYFQNEIRNLYVCFAFLNFMGTHSIPLVIICTGGCLTVTVDR